MIPDDVYVRKAVEGDNEAFDVLVKHHRPKIYEVVHRKLSNPTDATEETFARVREHIEAFQGRTPFGTWVYRIAVNLCLEYNRSSNLFANEVSDLAPEW
jgi:RNA polymerase sigma-70 factor (ECF subfamily)